MDILSMIACDQARDAAPHVRAADVESFFKRNGAVHLVPSSATAGPPAAYLAVHTSSSGSALRQSQRSPLDLSAKSVQIATDAGCRLALSADGKLDYTPQACSIVYDSDATTGTRWTMTVADAASMAFGLDGAHLAHGDLASGPCQTMDWLREHMARLPADTVPPAQEVVCRAPLMAYLVKVDSTQLPSVRDVVPSLATARDTDWRAMCALNLQLCDVVRDLYFASIEATVAELRQSRAVDDSSYDAIRDHLRRLVGTYLEWRYVVAPRCARGAAAMVAAICCTQPVVCSWIQVELPRYSRSPNHSITDVVVANNQSYQLAEPEYQRARIALSLAQLFAESPQVLPFAGATALRPNAHGEACVALLAQRGAALSLIATQFSTNPCAVAVWDATEFTEHRDVAEFNSERALAVLRSVCPLGANVRPPPTLAMASNYEAICIAAPGVTLQSAPLALVWSRHVVMTGNSAFGDAAERRAFVSRHVAAMLRLGTGPPVAHKTRSCIGVWPAKHYVNVRVSKFGSRTPPDAVGDDGLGELLASSVPLHAMPCTSPAPLAVPPPNRVIECRSDSDVAAITGGSSADSATAPTSVRLLQFLRRTCHAHATLAPAAAAEPDPDDDAAAARAEQRTTKRAARAPAERRARFNRTSTRKLVAAILYWYTHCQNTVPALHCPERSFAAMCAAIERTLGPASSGRATACWIVDERSPLAPLCHRIADYNTNPCGVVSSSSPILHVRTTDRQFNLLAGGLPPARPTVAADVSGTGMLQAATGLPGSFQ